MKFTASQIASILNGKIEGDEQVSVSKLSKIEEGEKGSISFLSNVKYTNYIYNTQASIVIVNDNFKPEKSITATLIKVDDAYQAFTQLLTFYNQVKLDKKGIENPSFISDSASLGEEPYVGAFAYIGKNVKIGDNVKVYPQAYIGDNVTIGNNTTLFSGVKVYSESIIGNDCIMHSNAVIGSDGFGFAPTKKGDFKKIPQIGNVVIGDGVEIGSETTVDRATLGSTRIGDGVKLDNLIQVAHNVVIGENTVIAAQTGIAGSAKIGKNCMIGGQVAIAGHITVPNNTKIGAKAGIAASPKKEGLTLQGSPALEVRDFFRSSAVFKVLPEIKRQVDMLTKQINKIQNGETKND
jgi:UDP-3-O-[3-hydroxymyristoyl] glucosamine N-acyltransferase